MAYLGNSPANALFNLTPPIELEQDQTVVVVNYTPGRVTWFKNGAMLIPTIDIIAIDGSTATLASPANAGDVLWAVNFGSFKVADAVPFSGGTLSGPLTGPSSASESVAGLAKFATAAEAQGDARNVALSPGGLADAFGGDSQLVSLDAWHQKIPGGLIIQGGRQQGAAAGVTGTETIVYPLVFPTMCVALTPYEMTSIASDVTTLWSQGNIEASRSEGTVVWRKDSGSGGAGVGLFGWIAYGF